LQAALRQYGPWKNKNMTVDHNWLRLHFLEKIEVIDWQAAVADVERFLDSSQQRSLSLWNRKFFTHKVDSLQEK